MATKNRISDEKLERTVVSVEFKGEEYHRLKAIAETRGRGDSLVRLVRDGFLSFHDLEERATEALHDGTYSKLIEQLEGLALSGMRAEKKVEQLERTVHLLAAVMDSYIRMSLVHAPRTSATDPEEKKALVQHVTDQYKRIVATAADNLTENRAAVLDIVEQKAFEKRLREDDEG